MADICTTHEHRIVVRGRPVDLVTGEDGRISAPLLGDDEVEAARAVAEADPHHYAVTEEGAPAPFAETATSPEVPAMAEAVTVTGGEEQPADESGEQMPPVEG